MAIITDANVLIDYAKSDIGVLAVYSARIATISIPSVILDEVEQLDRGDCAGFGLEVIDEPYGIIAQAAATRRGPLSFEDRVCLLLAKQTGMECVTNEKPLRKACQKERVKTKRGLRLMIEMVHAGHLEGPEALAIAVRIHENNPMYITPEIVKQFRSEI